MGRGEGVTYTFKNISVQVFSLSHTKHEQNSKGCDTKLEANNGSLKIEMK